MWHNGQIQSLTSLAHLTDCKDVNIGTLIQICSLGTVSYSVIQRRGKSDESNPQQRS